LVKVFYKKDKKKIPNCSLFFLFEFNIYTVQRNSGETLDLNINSLATDIVN
jgi:hypothetical protein